MSSPLQNILTDGSLSLEWVGHSAELPLGPFGFPPDVPVPVGEVRDETPAFYLLGICRETTGDDEGAISACERFLASSARGKFPEIAAESMRRSERLLGEKAQSKL